MSAFKIAAFRKAELALAKQIAAFEELKTDPELRKELEFVAKLDEFLNTYGWTRPRLYSFLASQGPAGAVEVKAGSGKPAAKAKTTPTKGQGWAGRSYTNPHTQETIVVKRKDHGVLQSWIAKYGEETVTSWQSEA